MTTSIDTGRKTRPWAVAVYLGFVFVLILSWMVIQPLNASPDELMRYDIVEYLVEHGTLPDGRDPEIRHELWGISYAFNPILAYMIMAIPAKFVSLFTDSSTAVLLAARLVNAVFGTIMAYLTLRIGEMLFRGRAKWMFASLVTFLPGLVFVHSYVNNDSMALLSVTWIVYTWIRSMKEGWSVKICVHLACAISLCGLSYYNAYGYALCSILFFVTTVLLFRDTKMDIKFLLSRGALITAIVLVLIGWWFVRNAIIYDGDFMGRNTSSLYAEMYAIEELKPSNRQTPQTLGMSIPGMMIWQPEGWPHNWLITVMTSFVGTFGFMNIYMPYSITRVYFLVCGIGFLGTFVSWRPLFSPHFDHMKKVKEQKGNLTVYTKKIYNHKSWNPRSVFHICMAIAMIIPCILLVIYAYGNDFQAQGRYVLPMIIPFMYFVTYGYQTILNRLIKSEKRKEYIYSGIAVLCVIGVLVTYFVTFLPNYR